MGHWCAVAENRAGGRRVSFLGVPSLQTPVTRALVASQSCGALSGRRGRRLSLLGRRAGRELLGKLGGRGSAPHS